MIRSTLKDKRFFRCSKVIEFACWREKRQYCQCSVWNDSRGFKRQCDQQDMLILSQFVKQFLSEIIFYNLKISRHFVLNYRTLFQLILIHLEFMDWCYMWPEVFLFLLFGNVSSVKLSYNLQSSEKNSSGPYLQHYFSSFNKMKLKLGLHSNISMIIIRKVT